MSDTQLLSSSAMEAALAAFQDWRRSRKKRSRIPAHLLIMAANLYIHNHFPLSTICRNLGLNWGNFKKKLHQLSFSSLSPLSPLSSQSPVGSSPHPSFIELKLNKQNSLLPIGHSPDCPDCPDCIVEVTRPEGSIMKIFASNDTPLNVLELFKTFLEPSDIHQ